MLAATLLVSVVELVLGAESHQPAERHVSVLMTLMTVVVALYTLPGRTDRATTVRAGLLTLAVVTLLRSAFRVLVAFEPDMTVTGEAADGAEAVRVVRERGADVVVMDIRMPGTDGLAATRAISADPALRDVGVLILTTFGTDDHVVQALRVGASGFLGRSAEPDELLHAVRLVERPAGRCCHRPRPAG